MGKSGEKGLKEVPKGCLAIKVGEGEEQERIVVPVIYLNHPLFAQLLKEAEQEYGFAQRGTIIIPCQLEHFRYVQAMIHRETSLQHRHHNHLARCFRVAPELWMNSIGIVQSDQRQVIHTSSEEFTNKFLAA